MIVSAHDTAVVVLSYNGRAWHEQFLPGIVAEADGQYDVILADNASTDDTLPWVRANFPTVKTLHIGRNRGFSHGYREALESIEAKYYILLSADFEVTPGWFPPLLEAMQRYPGLAACQPKIRYWREREKFEYAGAAGGFMDRWGYLFCRGRLFAHLEDDRGQYDDDIEVFWASGGCLMVRADLYHKLGGLDSDLYAHMEEVDLCWRLKNAGYRVGAIGGSTVFHVGGSVISYGSPQKLYYNFRNNLVLLIKNERAGKLLWFMPFRTGLDVLAAAHYVVKGQLRSAFTILKAHAHFWGRLGLWLRKRREAKVHRTHRNKCGIYPGSVVWQYFALRRRKFPDLKWTAKRL